MQSSKIEIDVHLDEKKVPFKINWKADSTTADEWQAAKAMMLSFWDGSDKSAMRIDLWIKDMMVDEMADFFYQTIMSMADTYNRATHHEELVNDMKKFAKDFMIKFREAQIQQNK